MDLSVVPYGEMGRGGVEVGFRGGAGEWKAAEGGRGGGGRYRECMRNHAAAIGGQAYDGCGEFMPGGDGGSLEALKCAACGCHRNFHRRDGASASQRRPLLLPPPGFPAFLTHPVPVPVPYHQIRHHPPSALAYDGSRAGSETPPRRDEERQAAVARARKRHRTKFTAEQKEKMQAFAERLGWRIQKHDDVALQEFCVEIGVKRHVLKVWMHNNKTSHSPSASKPDAAAAAATPPIRV